MIRSITIKHPDGTQQSVDTGVFKPSISNGLSTTINGNTMSLSFNPKDTDGYKQATSYYNQLQNPPYITSINGVGPDERNTIWIMGDNSFRVTYAPDTNTPPVVPTLRFALCDMKPTVPVNVIYQAVFDMLKQLRLWIDNMKNNLVMTKVAASEQWAKMVQDDIDNKYPWTKPADTADPNFYPLERYVSSVDNDNTQDIDEATPMPTLIGICQNLVNEYKSLVFIWNYLVRNEESDIMLYGSNADTRKVFMSYAAVVGRCGENECGPEVCEQGTYSEHKCSQKYFKARIKVTMTGQTGTDKLIKLIHVQSSTEELHICDEFELNGTVYSRSALANSNIDPENPASGGLTITDTEVAGEYHLNDPEKKGLQRVWTRTTGTYRLNYHMAGTYGRRWVIWTGGIGNRQYLYYSHTTNSASPWNVQWVDARYPESTTLPIITPIDPDEADDTIPYDPDAYDILVRGTETTFDPDVLDFEFYFGWITGVDTAGIHEVVAANVNILISVEPSYGCAGESDWTSDINTWEAKSTTYVDTSIETTSPCPSENTATAIYKALTTKGDTYETEGAYVCIAETAE